MRIVVDRAVRRLGVLVFAGMLLGLPLAAAENPTAETTPEPSLDWLFQPVQELAACTVSIQCTSSIKISCSSAAGNCTTSGGGDCVVCDGITGSCCSSCLACRSACLADFWDCRDACNTRDCIGECMQARDACYASCC